MHRASTLGLFGGALVVGMSLAACSVRRGPPMLAPTSALVPETGVVLDLGQRNLQVVFAQPGDVLQIPLIGQVGSGYQWSYRMPLSGEYLTMKKHVMTEQDARLTPGQFLSAWVFKIEKPATFDLTLVYENPSARQRRIAERFSVKVIADQSADQVGWVLLDQLPTAGVAKGTLPISGYARVEVGTIAVRLSDAAGVRLASASIVPPATSLTFYPFDQVLRFRSPATPVGQLALSVTATVPETGPPPDPVVVRVVFDPTVTSLQVYLGNRQMDATGDCAKVFPVTRYVPKSENLMRAAIQALVRGPSGPEKRAGYFSSLPSGVALRSVEAKGATVTVDFSQTLDRTPADPCRVRGIRAQVVETLRQFSPQPQEVVIAVAGRIHAELQP